MQKISRSVYSQVKFWCFWWFWVKFIGAKKRIYQIYPNTSKHPKIYITIYKQIPKTMKLEQDVANYINVHQKYINKYKLPKMLCGEILLFQQNGGGRKNKYFPPPFVDVYVYICVFICIFMYICVFICIFMYIYVYLRNIWVIWGGTVQGRGTTTTTQDLWPTDPSTCAGMKCPRSG